MSGLPDSTLDSKVPWPASLGTVVGQELAEQGAESLFPKAVVPVVEEWNALTSFYCLKDLESKPFL